MRKKQTESRRTKGTGTIFKKANGNFIHRYLGFDGKIKTVSLKNDSGNPVTTLKEAEAVVETLTQERLKIENIESKAEAIVKIAECKGLIKKKQLPRTNIWQKYFDCPNRPDSGELTLKRYRDYLNKFLAFVGDSEITPDTAAAYMLQLWEKGIASRTYNYHLQALKLIFRITYKEENPFAELKAKSAETESRKPFTADQINDIFNTLNGEGYHMLHKDQMRMLLLLGLCFGLRLHDAACFKWDYIQGETVCFKPAKTKRKNKADTILPIPPVLMEQFNFACSWKRNDFVLPDVAERYEYNGTGISQDVNKLLERSGIVTKEKATDARRQIYTDTQGKTKQRKIGRYSFHSLRHTFCTIAANSGKDLSLVKSIVGHSNIAMTEHYSHYNIEAKRSVINAIPLSSMTNSIMIPQNNETKFVTAFQKADVTSFVKAITYLENKLSVSQKQEILGLLAVS